MSRPKVLSVSNVRKGKCVDVSVRAEGAEGAEGAEVNVRARCDILNAAVRRSVGVLPQVLRAQRHAAPPHTTRRSPD